MFGKEKKLVRRNYGDNGTIHHTGFLDVEVYKGEVVAVWFRCLPIRFKQVNVEKQRAESMRAQEGALITAVTQVVEEEE